MQFLCSFIQICLAILNLYLFEKRKILETKGSGHEFNDLVLLLKFLIIIYYTHLCRSKSYETPIHQPTLLPVQFVLPYLFLSLLLEGLFNK